MSDWPTFLASLPGKAFEQFPTITVVWVVAMAACIGWAGQRSGGDSVDPPADYTIDYGKRSS